MLPTRPALNSVVARAAIRESSAQGQAALLLSEDILCALAETSTISSQEIVASVQTTREVKIQLAALTGEDGGRSLASLDLLPGIQASFEDYDSWRR
jgi:phosphoheptose isomerase